MKYKAIIQIEVLIETDNSFDVINKVNSDLVDELFELELLETLDDLKLNPSSYNSNILLEKIK